MSGGALRRRAARSARSVWWQSQQRAYRVERRYRSATRRPPHLKSGWTTGPPDFVGVGAQKAGTSWWHAALATHPRVHQPRTAPKEHAFFGRFAERPFTERDAELYHWEFPRPPGALAGEWTPRYMFDFWTPPLLARAAPEARILVLLRDPVERYRSSVRAQLVGGGNVAVIASEAYARGFYFEQLSRLLEHVPREQLLVLQYEQCRADPRGELGRTFAFLGLDDVDVPAEVLGERVNPTRAPALELDEPIVEALRRAYAEDTGRLFAAFPELDPALWNHDGGA